MGKNLLARFDAIDANRDGTIDRAELSTALKSLQLFQRRREAANSAAAPTGGH